MPEKGKLGEDVAARFLEEKGFKVISRNFRSRRGEVDIVAMQDDILVFVEVKSWDALPRHCLEQSITTDKKKRIQDAARYFLFRHPEFLDNGIRFDLVFVTGGLSQVSHYEDAFTGVDATW